MQDVLCHMTGYDVDLTEADRSVLVHYAYRSLLIATEEDEVVLPGLPKPVELIALLNDLQVGPRSDRVYTDLAQLRGRRLEPFSGATPKLWQLVELAQCSLACPDVSTCVRANNKGWFQQRFGSFPEAYVPDGLVCRGCDVGEHVQRLMRRHARPVRLKAVASTSGLKQMVFFPGEPVVLPAGTYPSDTFVLQVEMPRHLDASVQFDVGEHGEVVMGPVVAQHIRGQGNHGGNFFPAYADLSDQPPVPEQLAAQMLAAANLFAHGLADIGYFGPASADFIADMRASRAWAVEVNARVTAPRYPLRAAERWYGPHATLPFDSRSFRFPKGMSVFELARHFNDLLFNRSARYGFIPFTIIPEHGVCVGVAYAPDEHALLSLVQQVEERKLSLL